VRSEKVTGKIVCFFFAMRGIWFVTKKCVPYLVATGEASPAEIRANFVVYGNADYAEVCISVGKRVVGC